MLLSPAPRSGPQDSLQRPHPLPGSLAAFSVVRCHPPISGIPSPLFSAGESSITLNHEHSPLWAGPFREAPAILLLPPPLTHRCIQRAHPHTPRHWVCCIKVISVVSDLCDPMNYSLPGSSVLGILQARIWSGLPCPSPGDLPESGIQSVSLMSPSLEGRFFMTSATWEASQTLGDPK